MIKIKAEKLLLKSEFFWDAAAESEQKQAMEFGEDYKKFLNNAKTEEEVIKESIKLAEKSGYQKKSLDDKITGKDRKLIFVNRKKSLLMVAIGKNKLAEGIKMLLAHVDSPRMDLKVRPLYEDTGIAYFKPNYYGGIKKYHWPTVPLEMRGRVVLTNGEEVAINIGAGKEEPIFLISDLLPHLEKERMNKPLKEAIEAEEMNIIVGSKPIKDKKAKERVKLAILEWLNNNYKIKEIDLISADIRFVPAFPARDVGLDRSMVGAYGQDDRVCVYTGLRAFLAADNEDETRLLYLADKEEIGSVGATAASSLWLENVIDYLIRQWGLAENLYDIFRKSRAISADVTAAYDPDYKSAYDPYNSVYLGKGVAIEKFLGYLGKMKTIDADPKALQKIISLFERKKVVWQTGHLGKVDQGGGGTIAVYLANRNTEVIDIGVPILNMHSPYELSSKADIYSAYKGYRVFLNNK